MPTRRTIIDLSFLKDLPVQIYTSSLPSIIRYPFILTHIDSIDRERPHFQYASKIIVDIHVHRFRKHGDYPISTLLYYYYIVYSLARRWGKKIIIVLPDLPYDPDYFHGVKYPENIRKTYTYHYMFLSKIVELCKKYDCKFIPVIQHRQNIDDIIKSTYIVMDIVDRYSDYVYGIGLGSLCVERSIKKIVEYYRIIRKVIGPSTKIHLFGVSIRTLDYLSSDNISIDSTGWTKPISRELLKYVQKWRSCYNEHDRILYFLFWIKKICEKLNEKEYVKKIEEIIYNIVLIK